MKLPVINFSTNDIVRRSIFFGLAFAHLITAFYWFKGRNWEKFETENFRIFCYPIFKNCHMYVFENILIIKSIYIIYIILSIFVLGITLLNKKKLSFYLIFILTLLKTGLLLSRYNFMGNYHTMHLSLSYVALLSYGSINFYRFSLILQYVFAGLLKTNIEWMAGAALVKYSQYMLKGFWNSLSLSYVVVLELILIWGLLSKNKHIRYITLAQIIIFHLYSTLIVGFYYPLIMTGLLIPIVFIEFTKEESNNSFKFEIDWRKLTTLGFIVLMIVWNLSTKFYSIDPTMDGNVRYLSLNMLDAKLKCQSSLYEEQADGTIIGLNIPQLATYLRIHCDALVFETFLKRLCLKNPDKKFMFYLESTRTTDKEYTMVREYKNVCKEI